MNIEILFENKDIVVINKPSGITVHGDGKTKEKTIADWVKEKYPDVKSVGEPMFVDGEELDRPGIVHRLDEETSGALIVAKKQESFENLKKQFQDHKIQKEYHAFVWGHFKEKTGKVVAPIGRSKNDFRKWLSGRGVRGELRKAETFWVCANQFEDENKEKFSFLNIFPKTGRTHQIRVHMKYIQRPIVGDSLYAESKPFALGFNRLALHAKKITFFDLEGKNIEVLAPYPEDFSSAIAKYVLS